MELLGSRVLLANSFNAKFGQKIIRAKSKMTLNKRFLCQYSSHFEFANNIFGVSGKVSACAQQRLDDHPKAPASLVMLNGVKHLRSEASTE
jgi:hypothetical protein